MVIQIYVADICITVEAQIYCAKAIYISPVNHDVLLCQPAHEFTDNGVRPVGGTRCTMSITQRDVHAPIFRPRAIFNGRACLQAIKYS